MASPADVEAPASSCRRRGSDTCPTWSTRPRIEPVGDPHPDGPIRRRLHVPTQPRGSRLPGRRGPPGSLAKLPPARASRWSVGASTGLRAHDPRISYLGFVPDLGDAYARAACVVIPLLIGGGSPLKFVEALAYGSAMVATPIAAPGIEAVAGRDYLEESDPEAFAEAVARVLRHEADELRRHARDLAERSYSIESLRERLREP